MAFLEVNDLHKSFGDNEVLKGVDVTLDKGEVLAVIGASGNGKTTFLRCLNFLTLADKGTIAVDGNVIFDANTHYSDAELRRNRLQMGMVFQGYNLFPQYTVLKNTYLAANLRLGAQAREYKATLPKGGRARAVRQWKAQRKQANVDAAKALLIKMGLENEMGKYPCELSGGQSQRAAISRALMLSPAVLCFDEPTSALDPKLTAEVLGVIRALKAEGRTMIVVTHEMAFAASCADKIVYFHEGRIAEEGGSDIIANPQTDELKEFLLYSAQGQEPGADPLLGD